MTHGIRAFAASLALTAMLPVAPALAHGPHLDGDLEGFQEVPVVSSTAHGEFRARISKNEASITYELTYSGLEGDVRQAHIHAGQKGVNGGIVVFLCQTTFNPDPTGLAPTCPQAGTVTGTLTVANLAPNAQAIGQGFEAGEFGSLIRALREGVAYANVHTTKFPGGEIRAQLK